MGYPTAYRRGSQPAARPNRPVPRPSPNPPRGPTGRPPGYGGPRVAPPLPARIGFGLAGRVAGRLIPYLGWGLLAYDLWNALRPQSGVPFIPDYGWFETGTKCGTPVSQKWGKAAGWGASACGVPLGISYANMYGYTVTNIVLNGLPGKRYSYGTWRTEPTDTGVSWQGQRAVAFAIEKYSTDPVPPMPVRVWPLEISPVSPLDPFSQPIGVPVQDPVPIPRKAIPYVRKFDDPWRSPWERTEAGALPLPRFPGQPRPGRPWEYRPWFKPRPANDNRPPTRPPGGPGPGEGFIRWLMPWFDAYSRMRRYEGEWPMPGLGNEREAEWPVWEWLDGNTWKRTLPWKLGLEAVAAEIQRRWLEELGDDAARPRIRFPVRPPFAPPQVPGDPNSPPAPGTWIPVRPPRAVVVPGSPRPRPGRPPLPTPRPRPLRPPQGKERKVRASSRTILRLIQSLAYGATEVQDWIDALYRTLPAKYRTARGGAQRVRAVLDHWRTLDPTQAIIALIAMEIGDQIIGRSTARAQRWATRRGIFLGGAI